jgi:hypothetical protein
LIIAFLRLSLASKCSAGPLYILIARSNGPNGRLPSSLHMAAQLSLMTIKKRYRMAAGAEYD